MAPPKWLTRSVALFLTWSATAQAGWYLDESCYNDRDMIQKAMTSAFDLASAGDRALHDVIQPGNPNSAEARKAQMDLVSYVFEEMMDGDKVNSGGNEYRDARFTLDNLMKFKDFKGIARAENLETVNKRIAQTQGKPYNPPKSPPSGVKVVKTDEYHQKENIFVYCDFSRFGEIGKDCSGNDWKPKDPNDKKEYRCNKNLGVIETVGDTAQKCEHQDPDQPGKTEMYTSSYGGPKFDPKNPSTINTPKPSNVHSSEIQVCPAYMAVWKKEKIKTFEEQGQQPAAARGLKSLFKAVDKALDKAIDKIWSEEGLTQMDLYKTADVILVHEMTHGIWGFGLNDVDGKDAYGWKNVRRISKRKSSNNLEKATNNADNFGYFCLGSKMITPGGSKVAQRAEEDGSIKALLPKKGKRDVSAAQALRRDAPIGANPYDQAGSPDVGGVLTTLRRLVRRQVPVSSASGSPPQSPGDSQTGGPTDTRRIIYTTLEEIFTTVVTKEITKPISTIDGTGPPAGGSSTSSQPGGNPSSVSSGSSTRSGGSSSQPGGSSTHSSGGPGGSSTHSGGGPSQPSGSPSGSVTPPPGGGSSATPPPGSTTTDADTQETTVTVTSDHKTSTVVFVGAPLPTPGGGGPPAWKCTGPICDPKCLFPVLCKDTGGGWGLEPGWSPVPPPGGPPPPPGGPTPAPTEDGKPTNSGPSNSKPTDSKTESKESSEQSTTQSSTESSSTCSPRTTSVCPVVATHIQGPDGHDTTKMVTQSCKTTTLHDCTTQVHGSTSTTAVTEDPVVTPVDFGDDFDMGIDNWISTRDAALAALVADTTDPYEYPGETGSSTNPGSTASQTQPPSSSASQPPTSNSTHEPSSTHQSSNPPSSKPSSQPSSQPSSHSSGQPSATATTTSGGPKPSSTKYSERCKDWSITDDYTVVGTCTDKDGKEVKTKEDMGLCLHYNNGGLSPQDNGGIDKDCKYCFFNPKDWPDYSTIWCVCKNDKDPFSKSASAKLDDVLSVMDNGYVKCFDHISAPA